jgi:hypothetical protein
VSKLFGKTDQYFESHSQSRGESNTITSNSKNEGTSKSFAIQQRDRIKPQDILQFDVGHFCGILVEGSNKEFNTRFKNISCEPGSMPERNFFFDVESILGLSMHRLKSLFSKNYPYGLHYASTGPSLCINKPYLSAS